MCHARLSAKLAPPVMRLDNGKHTYFQNRIQLLSPQFKDVRTAHCARKFTRHVMHRARALRNKMTLIGKMAIATGLRGFNDLRLSLTPTFLSRNRFYLQWSTHCPKMNKNWAWEVKKNSRFLSTGHRILSSCDCKVRETMVAKFELVL